MLKTVQCCLALLFVGLATDSVQAAVITIDGTVKSVDAEKRTITVKTKTKTLKLDVSRKAKISVKSETAKLDSLKVGQKVKISYHDGLEIVLKIEVLSQSIKLFNGKDLKGWKALNNKKTGGWIVNNSELILVPRKGTPSLVSEDKFDDFEFECEFWLDKGANSGVYLRGRYELQLLDDRSFPRIRPNQKCGAIYGQLPPSRSAYRGPKRWNTLSVRLERKTVTVVLNGVKVIDHRYINKVTPFAIDDLEGQPGPIILQNHGSSVRFKNITIRRLAR
jgi:hypothetical protein